MSFSESEKRLVIAEQDKAIEEADLDMVYIRVRVPGHALLIMLGLVIVVFGFFIHGV
jgi:hypothetical protein